MAAWRTLMPGLSQDLRPWTRGNSLAGLTVTAYLVPQVMAYAVVAGLPPVTGLWAMLISMLIYPFMGTSRLLSIGPESSAALMTAAVTVPLVASDPSELPTVAAALAVTVGLIGLVASLLRLSFVSDLLSRPILVGYMAGIAVLMIDSQLDKLLGIRTPPDTGVVEHTWDVILAIPQAQWPVVAVSASVLAFLFILDGRWPRVPVPLFAVLVGVGVAGVLGAAGFSVPLIGDIPTGLPHFAVPSVQPSDLSSLLLGGIGVTIVAFTDCTLTGRAFREHGDLPIDPAAELRSLSVANTAVGFFQGMPVSSSGSRTALAKATGATGQGYSLGAAVFLAAVLLFASPLLSIIPISALAALIVYAAVGLIDVPDLRKLWRFSKPEFSLAIVTWVGVLILGVLYGVLVAIALSMLVMFARVARPHSAALGFAPGVPGMHDVEDFPESAEEPGLLVFRYDSTLFFANAEHFLEKAREAVEDRSPDVRWFALNSEAIVEVDSTAVDALETLAHELDELGIRFVLVRAKRELIDKLGPTGLVDQIGMEHIYPTLPTLVAEYRKAKSGPVAG